MSIRREVLPFIAASVVAGGVVALLVWLGGAAGAASLVQGAGLLVVLTGYFILFFRDPERTTPGEEGLVVAGADGHLAGITEVREDRFLKAETTRISIFLSLFDVHVNRAPIEGRSRFMGYFPGKRLFTFREKSSAANQHNAILIEGQGTRCLVNQIVGPVCRRVVYWLDHETEVEVGRGQRIGMMKFGSRLDMYFPKGDIEVVARVGDRVRAGETVIARLVRDKNT